MGETNRGLKVSVAMMVTKVFEEVPRRGSWRGRPNPPTGVTRVRGTEEE